MSLCRCFRQRWNEFRNCVYGYDETVETDNIKTNKTFQRKRGAGENMPKNVMFAKTNEGLRETRSHYGNECGRRAKKFEAYGIKFESRHERDAFKGKMESLEKIYQNELNEIKQQHERIQRENLQKSKTNQGNDSLKTTTTNTWITSSKNGDESEFVPTDEDPLLEEMCLLNEFQDVYEHMFHLNNELANLEKILSIEIRERILHPEPQLVHLRAPDDELSQKMKNDGGLKYYSSDNRLQQITYEALPPPLRLSTFLINENTSPD